MDCVGGNKGRIAVFFSSDAIFWVLHPGSLLARLVPMCQLEKGPPPLVDAAMPEGTAWQAE